MKIRRHLRYDSATLLAVTVFLALFILLLCSVPCTLMSWESSSLYLSTPDYMRELDAASQSTSDLCLNFLFQFFYFKWAGPAILALVVALPLWLLMHFIHSKAVRVLLTLCPIIAVGCFAIHPDTQQTERWNKLEQAAENYRWAEVLQVANPERCQSERGMLPYALLALAAKGQLPECMCQYPVQAITDFDSQGENTRHYYIFKMVFYDVMGSTQEAIHNAMQAAAVGSPYGMDMGTLRRLVRLHRKSGNDVMANKYASVLKCSTLHKNWKVSDAKVEDVPHKNESAAEPLITESLGFNIGVMLNSGTASPVAIDYLLCQLLVGGNLDNFVAMLQRITQDKSGPLPRHYQEALLCYAHQHPSFDLGHYTISPALRSAFQQFIASDLATPDSYWATLSVR